MSVAANVPMEVLSRALGDRIGGRRVCAGVFTTFCFDPGFFELHVLPLLFGQPLSHVDKVRRIQLEDALRDVSEIAVYYDRGGLSQDAEPARLDYRRIDVRRPTGVFHPKLVLLLVEEPREEDGDSDSREAPPRSLVVCLLSANLTRAGWWENVECAHFEEIRDREVDERRCPFRHDLLALLQRIRSCARPDEDHAALDAIHAFLKHRAEKERFRHGAANGAWYTRIFCGQGRESLPSWLRSLGLARHAWNLEVISPFFDPTGAGPLSELIDVLAPAETRIFLPREADGQASVTRPTYEAIAKIARWSRLPDVVTARGRSEQAERLAPRCVHAKLYRLWHRDGRDLWLVGSTNLTHAAMSHGGAGNLEASWLVDVSAQRLPRRWWLEPIDADVERFLDREASEADGLDDAPIDLSLRYDWSAHSLCYRADRGIGAFDVAEIGGPGLFTVERPVIGEWIPCGVEAAARVEAILRATSFLAIRHATGSWRVLVREENVAHRPSLLHELSPEEILEYWALLTPEQRAHFLESHAGGMLDGLRVSRTDHLGSRNTLFDRFAGIFHAFGCLRRHVEAALASNRTREAESRLFGAKYDSLPVLLQKTLDQENADPIASYVTFLCAKQLIATIERSHRDFIRSCSDRSAALRSLLLRGSELSSEILAGESGGADFLLWYEAAFLEDASSRRGAR